MQPPGKMLPVASNLPESIPHRDIHTRVDRRARGFCEISRLVGCSIVPTDFHHRQPQGRIDTEENLVLVCREGHTLIHRYPEWARDVGLLIPRHMPLPDEAWVLRRGMRPHPHRLSFE